MGRRCTPARDPRLHLPHRLPPAELAVLVVRHHQQNVRAVRADRPVLWLEPWGLAVGETVILLHPRLFLVGVSIAMEREPQQSDSLANG